MKKLLFILSVLITSCSTTETKEIKEIKPLKTVYVPNSDSGTSKSFDVYLGSDGHEYQLHVEYRVRNQWIHYVGCTKCFKNK